MKYPRLLFFIVILACSACAAPVGDLFPPGENQPSKAIYLVTHGGHAGIVVKRNDIPEGVWPEHNDFPAAEYLEVGWGERDYYPMTDPHLGHTLKAGLWPTASVLHIVGFSGLVTDYFPHSEIIRIDLSYPGFERLCSYLHNSFAKDEHGNSIPLGPGHYGHSRFYLSRGSYHAFNTCNVWTARALRTAGCPITPAFALMVGSLMSRAATFGMVIQERPAGH